MNEENQDGGKTAAAFISGLLIGGLLIWVFIVKPEENAPVEELVESPVVEKATNRSDYSFCFRGAQIAQNPNFWTGDLEQPYTQKELTAFIDDCLSRL